MTGPREMTAFAVMDIIQRDRPQDFATLISRLSAESQVERQIEIAGEWCDALHLSSEWIAMAAHLLVLHPGDQPMDAALKGFVWTDALGELRDDRIQWRPGETKKDFLARADAFFDQMKELERQMGAVAASPRINRTHVEWLVRFQVNKESLTKIGGSDERRHDVKRAVHKVAELLELKLRKAPPGRPRGRGRSQRRTHRLPPRQRRR